MIITISGTPGSGKSTLAKSLAAILRWRRVDIGTMQRAVAKQRGLTYERYLRILEQNPRGDRTVDEYQRQLGMKLKKLIVESRLAFHFIPQSIKIFVSVSPAVGARRIWRELKKSNRRNEGVFSSPDDVEAAVRARMRSDRKRYQRYYGLNPFLGRHYDLVVDTSRSNPAQTLKKVSHFLSTRLSTRPRKAIR